MTIIYLCIAWLAGIEVGRDAPVGWWVWLALGLPALAGIILAPRADNESWTQFSWRTAFGCALLFTLGAARMALAIPHFGEGDLATYNDQGFVTVDGWLVDAPDVRDTQVNLRLSAESITLDEGETHPVKGLALVQAPRVGSYRYGDPVSVRGQIGAPPENDEFSYRDYLARQGVYSLVQYADVTVGEGRRGNPIRALALDFRSTAHRTIQRLLPDPQASLLAGILLGIESGISPDVRDAFNAVSATHVIAISGSNLVILAGVIQGITRRFTHERLSAGLTVGGVLGYALFVGGDPAVMRAALMVTLALLSTQLGRQTWGYASLAFAGLLMTAINPHTLWDVGFQLSFLSTLGLLLYVEPFQRGLERGLAAFFPAETARQVVLAVSDAFLVTIAAQIATAPLMAYTFGRFSAVALPVSFLIVPLQTPLMVLGGLSVLTALVVWPVGQVLAWGSWLFLTLTIWIVRRFARLPFASLDVSLSAGAMVGIYAGLLALTWLLSQDSETRARWRDRLRSLGGVKPLAGAGLVIALLLLIGAGSMPDGRLHVSFIDVGDGAATLVETPSGRTILVDAGGSSRQLQTALGDSLPFWQRRIDLVILTQPTQAHSGALSPLLDRYRVDAALVNGLDDDEEAAESTWEALRAAGVPISAAQPGTRVAVGDGVTITALDASDDAGVPLSLMITYGEARILLPGDLTPEAEAALLAGDTSLDSTVLRVPRQGHREANGEDFLAAADPQVAVLTVEAGNRFGLPHPETLDRLAALGVTLYRTDEIGTVHMVTDGEQLWVR